MIDVIKQTPYEYSKQSRDYQKLARIYTILYNLCKMYIDNMDVWGPDIDNKLSTLRSKTLNFDPKHSWSLDDLDSAVSCFKYIMMRKGTLQALKFCLTILMRSRKLSGVIDESLNTLIVEGNLVTIRIPQQLASAGVIEDLFEYLLPSGTTYRIVEYVETTIPDNLTPMDLKDSTESRTIKEENMGIYIVSGDDSTNEGATWYKNDVVNVNSNGEEING